MKKFIILLMIVAMLAGCSNQQGLSEESSTKQADPKAISADTVMEVVKDDFEYRLLLEENTYAYVRRETKGNQDLSRRVSFLFPCAGYYTGYSGSLCHDHPLANHNFEKGRSNQNHL